MRVFLLFLFLSPVFISPSHKKWLIVWNVGQGQWVTWRDARFCIHIDAGGEFAPLARIQKYCGDRKNEVYFTHGDWDHIRFADWIAHRLDACAREMPVEKLSDFKKRKLRKLRLCPNPPDSLTPLLIHRPREDRILSANAASRVYVLPTKRGNILISGDSTKSEEKQWSTDRRLTSVRAAILGHHGSRTSTSQFLLEHLPQLRLAIASARKRKYGHPHPEIKRRLATKGASLLSTETWGTIVLELE